MAAVFTCSVPPVCRNKIGCCPWLAEDAALLPRRPLPLAPRYSYSRRPRRPAVARSRSCQAAAAVWIARRGSAVPLRAAPLDCGSELACAAPPRQPEKAAASYPHTEGNDHSAVKGRRPVSGFVFLLCYHRDARFRSRRNRNRQAHRIRLLDHLRSATGEA